MRFNPHLNNCDPYTRLDEVRIAIKYLEQFPEYDNTYQERFKEVELKLKMEIILDE